MPEISPPPALDWILISSKRPLEDGSKILAAAPLFRAGTKELLYWQIDVWYFYDNEWQTDADPGVYFEDCLFYYPINLPELPADYEPLAF